MDITPTSSSRSGTPVLPRSRGRKQIRRDRSAVYRNNLKLQEEIEKLKRMCSKNKKRYQRAKTSIKHTEQMLSTKPGLSLTKTLKELSKVRLYLVTDSDIQNIEKALPKNLVPLQGVAKSEVDEEGDVKIMFYKTVDKTGKRFKAVDTNISYEPYDNILEIIPNPKIVIKELITKLRSPLGHHCDAVAALMPIYNAV
ncbi:unnamed protein product [Diatraea saccharalis]|uniref:Uncharacterized protein n=1 Tax=Diatraea saccharalis TaxID=40085 RepID=A0A9N9R567_9NEOP|nr:unnamed protein product [Diatraea saccharalis]